MVRPRCASRAASLYVATLLLTAAAQAILLQEEASYSELHQLPGSQTQNAPSSQNDQERRMRLFYVERKSLSNTSVLCNDGTAAGYYIRKSEKSSNWLIFLEGTCFNFYFHFHFRFHCRCDAANNRNTCKRIELLFAKFCNVASCNENSCSQFLASVSRKKLLCKLHVG